MKKYVLILASALAFAACQKEAAIKDEPVNGELNTFTFTAVVDDNVVDADTKASVNRGGVFAWAKDDALAFYDTDGTKYPAVVTAVDGSGVATIEVTAAGTPTFYSAIYPAAVATGKNRIDIGNAFAKGPVVIAEVGSGDLTFHHMGSVINIKISGIPAGTTKMEINPANPAEWSDGVFSFSAGVPDFSGTGAFCYPVVPVTSSDSDKDISVPIFAANYTGGFNIKLLNDAGRVLYEKTTTKDYDLSGTKLLNMKALTYAGPDVYYIKTVAKAGPGTDYWSQADMPLIKTGANTYSVTVNADRMSTYYIYDEWNTDDPTSKYIATGSTTSDTYSTNSYALIGDMNSWTTTNTDYPLNKVGDWNFGVFSRTALHNNKFKILPYNAESWDVAWGEASEAWFNTSTSSLTFTTSGNNSGFWFDSASDPDNLYFYFNDDTGNAQCYNTDTKSNPLCALVQFDLNTSTEAVTVTVKDQGVEYPFNDSSFPTTTYGFKSSIDDWASVHTMSYDNNWGWTYDLGAVAAGDYEFILITAENGYCARLSATWSTVDVGSNLYGTLAYWDTDANANVTLESGSYKLYVNPTYATEHSLNVMFVKE